MVIADRLSRRPARFKLSMYLHPTAPSSHRAGALPAWQIGAQRDAWLFAISIACCVSIATRYSLVHWRSNDSLLFSPGQWECWRGEWVFLAAVLIVGAAITSDQHYRWRPIDVARDPALVRILMIRPQSAAFLTRPLPSHTLQQASKRIQRDNGVGRPLKRRPPNCSTLLGFSPTARAVGKPATYAAGFSRAVCPMQTPVLIDRPIPVATSFAGFFDLPLSALN